MEKNSNTDDIGELSSKYKDSLNQIFRMDQLWQDCHRLSRAGELLKWNWTLDRVWLELGGDCAKEGNEEKELAKIDEDIKAAINDRIALYKNLIIKELWLRRLQNTQGKGSTYVDKDDEDFD